MKTVILDRECLCLRVRGRWLIFEHIQYGYGFSSSSVMDSRSIFRKLSKL